MKTPAIPIIIGILIITIIAAYVTMSKQTSTSGNTASSSAVSSVLANQTSSAAISSVISSSSAVSSPLSATTTTSCGMTLNVAGGTFMPRKCSLIISTPGVPCKEENGTLVACPPEYKLEMYDYASGHIKNIQLFGFDGLGGKTYRFSSGEFNGQLTDASSTIRNMKAGTVTMRSAGDDFSVSFDLTFADGYGVTGSGVLPVERVSES